MSFKSETPRNRLGVSLLKDMDLLSIDDHHSVLGAHLTLESSMGRVILEHVDHVVQINEWVINCCHLEALGETLAQDEPANTTKTVDSNAGCRHVDQT